MSLITINNQHIDPPVWESPALYDFSVHNRVDIWQINISSNLPHIDAFLKVLNPAEIERANKYLSHSDHDKFIISRGALRHILAKYLNQAAATIQFELAENKKPFIAHQTGTQIHFNLSDSADKVLIAVAHSEVGIDVELINQNFYYDDILDYNFSPEEARYIKLGNSPESFFLFWTRKEALLKATGIGLTDDLSLIPAIDGPHKMDGKLLSTQTNWQLNSFKPDESYIATIATATEIESLRFLEIDFDKVFANIKT